MILWVILILGLGATYYWLFMSSYSQVFGKFPYNANTRGRKIIALTLDDGPNEPYTSELLDFLEQSNIKATFFLVGKCIERHPDTVKKMLANGHVIANHSHSHEFKNYFKSLSFKKEIATNQKIISEITGKTPALFRCPWLWRQPFLLNNLKKMGLTPISGVFCNSLEPWQIDADTMAQTAVKKTKPGTIIIFHDGREGRGGDRKQSIEAVKIYVKAMKNKGYTFVTVDKLLGFKAYQ